MKAAYKFRACELCSGEARLHCASDAAYLCFDCDARVHGANFLVARHARQTLCSRCNSFTEKFISGELRRQQQQPLCTSCRTRAAVSSSTSSSDCISSTESLVRMKRSRPTCRTRNERERVSGCSSSASEISGVDSKAKGIFVIWFRRLGLNGNSYSDVVALAGQALELCLERSRVLPFRVCLAASFWAGWRMCCGDTKVGDATCQNLRRLEAVSGVPAKLILAVEGKLARAMTLRRRSSQRDQDLEEGWAECNA